MLWNYIRAVYFLYSHSPVYGAHAWMSVLSTEQCAPSLCNLNCPVFEQTHVENLTVFVLFLFLLINDILHLHRLDLFQVYFKRLEVRYFQPTIFYKVRKRREVCCCFLSYLKPNPKELKGRLLPINGRAWRLE